MKRILITTIATVFLVACKATMFLIGLSTYVLVTRVAELVVVFNFLEKCQNLTVTIVLMQWMESCQIDSASSYSQ